MSAKEYLRSVTQYNGRFHIDEVCAHMEAYHAAAMAEVRKEVLAMKESAMARCAPTEAMTYGVTIAILDKHLKP